MQSLGQPLATPWMWLALYGTEKAGLPSLVCEHASPKKPASQWHTRSMHSPLPLQLATHVEAGAQSAPMYPGSHRHWPFWQTPWWWQSAGHGMATLQSWPWKPG